VNPRFAIIGTGSVGLSLGARLAAAGYDTAVVARRTASADAIEARGITVHEPQSGQDFNVRVSGVGTLDAPPDLSDRVLIACVRAPDTGTLVDPLAALAPDAPIACAQNDIDNEAQFARRFAQVAGIVVRQTCWRTGPSMVNALGAGRLVIGAHPHGTSAVSVILAEAFRGAGFEVGVSDHILEDKWLKLCVNLMSVPNALISPAEHTRPEFAEIKAQIVEEAQAVLRAASIPARPCDGRDRSLEEEVAFQRAAVRTGQSARRLPVYNAVWASLDSGSPFEAERYHERILLLAREYGVDAPMNARALEVALRAVREGRPPESSCCADFLDP
jgi:2-dehydropantoate 2-reductase